MGPEGKDRDILVELGDEQDLFANVDPGQARQVIWNLLRNAVQATEANDELKIEVKREGNRVIFDVLDTGKGVPEEDKEKIFDPFYSKRERGLGLGLAVSRRIVDGHGGVIEVLDNEPKGAIFRVAFLASNSI